MIIQKFQQGKHEIRIESAESLEDAKKNGFPDNVYTRFFINDQQSDNYVSMMRFISENLQRDTLVPDEKNIIKTRSEMLNNQKEMMQKQIENMKNYYKKLGLPDNYLKEINKKIELYNDLSEKINPI